MLAAGAGNLGARVSGGAIAGERPITLVPTRRAAPPCMDTSDRLSARSASGPPSRRRTAGRSDNWERIEEARDALGERRQRVVDVRAHEERQGP
jgi:hypothetical protein